MGDVLNEGPFFHDTKAGLRVGEFLTAGYRSNYRPEVVMNHIYFTALPDEGWGWPRSSRPARALRVCMPLSQQGVRGRPERDRQEVPR